MATKGDNVPGEASSCPACRSRRQTFFCRHDEVSYARCRRCGTLFQASVPATHDLQRLYGEQYHAERGHADESGIVEAKKRTMREYLRLAKRWHPPGHRLLEIGCSAGAGLEAAAQSGWEATGVEISKTSADLANQRKGIKKVYAGQLEDAPLAKRKFDLAGFFDVLEHIAHPDKTLQRTWEVLRPGGLVMIVTPDGLSLSARWMHQQWTHFFLEHVVLYSRRGIQFALHRNGFAIEKTGFAWKWINLEMIKRHATVHGHTGGAGLFRQLDRLIPVKYSRFIFPFNFGEFFVLARRRG